MRFDRSLAAALALTVLAHTLPGCGREEGAGVVEGKPLPPTLVSSRSDGRRDASAGLARRAELSAAPDKQILFGDLHVHSTFSIDAFMMSLPFMQGEGAHPVADACDFARYCSALDFWSINDHAESLTPLRWRETKEAIRQCNEVAGGEDDPDLVTFLGWEWTQVGSEPANHYGHKNVIFRDTADDAVPARPIHSAGFASENMRKPPPLRDRIGLVIADPMNYQRYLNLMQLQKGLSEVQDCRAGVVSPELPSECLEGAPTPSDLFRKLDEWGFDSMVIPHGTTWGIYTPAGSSWDKQLTPAQNDPELQRNIEVFSGHGNSEEYRPWRGVELDADGNETCPEPSDGYEPCCWRAGEIIRARCEESASAECEKRVADARRNFVAADTAGRLTIRDAQLSDWGDCGTCQDCYLGSMNYRPASSAQYVLAISNFDDTTDPRRFHFGFIASSDNHRARPGTGYKEYGRLFNTEAHGARNQFWYERLYEEEVPFEDRAKESTAFDPADPKVLGLRLIDFERQASFFMTGGLSAVHAEGRSRDAIWDALQRREVYGTSGPRILLWFDLVNGPDGETPMGSKLGFGDSPRFRVRAAGALEQAEGCPDDTAGGLSPERLEKLCRGECYNPTDRRRRIDRIEVVRIRPQVRPGEDVAGLVEDPWRVLECPESTAEGCVVEFEDTGYVAGGRDTTYYVRAVQEPTEAVNAGQLRCGDAGCDEAAPCYGDYRTPADDDCLATNEERAWSSPIYLSHRR